MTPSENHKRIELDKCIRAFEQTGDRAAFNRANELRAELGIEEIPCLEAASIADDEHKPKKGKKK